MAGNIVKLAFGPDCREYSVGEIVHLAKDEPLKLDCGVEISDFPVAYQVYGELNEDKSNAIMVCHALTADQYVCGTHPVTEKSCWWDHMIGSGKTIDTDKYFIICPNIIGGCMGSFGPNCINKETGQPYKLDFPVITIGDMVNAQKLLIDYLGIEQLFSVIGGSMGGMQVLQWVKSYPKMLKSAIPIATALKHSAQNISFHEIGRQAIMADPDWCGGNYMDQNKFPSKGLSVARMTAHITYLSEQSLQRKFGRELQDRDELSYGFETDFQVEGYLKHQGISFIERFDPNSYLYITKAVDYFDLTDSSVDFRDSCEGCDISFCVISITTDWLYTTEEVKRIVNVLSGVSTDISFVEIESDKGHDAFLIEDPSLYETIKGFLGRVDKKC